MDPDESEMTFFGGKTNLRFFYSYRDDCEQSLHCSIEVLYSKRITSEVSGHTKQGLGFGLENKQRSKEHQRHYQAFDGNLDITQSCNGLQYGTIEFSKWPTKDSANNGGEKETWKS